MNALQKLSGKTERITALAPMDGVTDSAFRQITKKYGNPDLMFTEFVNVHGLCVAGYNLMHMLHYEEMERPIIAQLYGKNPEYFYHATKIICALRFDGVDINMGCPSKNVTTSGSGAALIKTPDLAKEIVNEVKRGVQDWVDDGKLTGIKPKVRKTIEEKIRNLQTSEGEVDLSVDRQTSPHLQKYNNPLDCRDAINHISTNQKDSPSFNACPELVEGRGLGGVSGMSSLPVSVKTRLGYNEIITEKWITTIAETKPDFISIHGRTFKQGYSGKANWDEIKKAVEVTDIPILANGDVKTNEDIEKILEHTGAVGAMIGRGAMGNPWIFSPVLSLSIANGEGGPLAVGEVPKIFKVMLEHAEIFTKLNPNSKAFVQMRKHFAWYIKGFEGASKLRSELVRTSSVEEVRKLLKTFQKSF